MSRKRYVCTSISVDARIRKLAEKSEFAALLYTWMIPHAADDGRITADPDELLMQVVPGFRWRTAEDIAQAIGQMLELGLLERDGGENLRFPPGPFYKYQSYIGSDRRPAPTPLNGTTAAVAPQNAADQREVTQNGAVSQFAPEPAQNRASVNSSSSSSFKSSSSFTPSGGTSRARARDEPDFSRNGTSGVAKTDDAHADEVELLPPRLPTGPGSIVVTTPCVDCARGVRHEHESPGQLAAAS